ncbi:MAG: hypothetical protein ACRD2W_20380, partial [Acidimicrobiales bacterium]
MAGRFAPNALLGAVLVLAGLLLPWIRATGLGSANAFDLPVGSLFNSGSPALDLGIPLLALAVVLPLPLPPPATVAAAAAIVVAVVLFVFQVQRGGVELTSVLGPGLLVTAIGALVAVPWRRRA